MAGDEIGMQVREEDVRDAEPVLLCKREVLVDVSLRIDDGGDPCLLVANQVRCMRQAVQIKLMKDHNLSTEARQPSRAIASEGWLANRSSATALMARLRPRLRRATFTSIRERRLVKSADYG